MMNESDSSTEVLKPTCNGSGEEELAGTKLEVGPDSAVTCNGSLETEDDQDSYSNNKESNLTGVHNPSAASDSGLTENSRTGNTRKNQSASGEIPPDLSHSNVVQDKSYGGPGDNEKLHEDKTEEAGQDCGMDVDEDSAKCDGSRSAPKSSEPISETDNDCDKKKVKRKTEGSDLDSSLEGESAGAQRHTGGSEGNRVTKTGENVKSLDEINKNSKNEEHIIVEGTAESDVKPSDVGRKLRDRRSISRKDKKEIESENKKDFSGNIAAGDDQKENTKKLESKEEVAKNKHKNVNLSKNNQDNTKNDQHGPSGDTSVDDVEIIGESKVAQVKGRNSSFQSSQSPGSISGSVPMLGQGLPGLSNSQHGSPFVRGMTPAPSGMRGPVPGYGGPRFSPGGGLLPQGPPNVNLFSPAMTSFVPTVAPPKPQSSLDQIELIRWEIQNRINTRPKYFKPSPASELGPLAKYLFDIGSDLIKEAVYHDLVKIQSRKNSDDKLSDKEKEDLEKLKEIEKDLFATIGHLKVKLKKRCGVCNFQTESNNVMFHHKQFPHEDNKNMRCAYCPFSTKQAMAFKFHMEAEHNMQGRIHDKKAFYECDLCQYENNQEQKVTLHKQRCIKQFRPLFNLHPSCLSGAEINLCLENIFYKTVVPKNLKILQQKHAQQQAALAEARRQQAEMQALAAQKNATVTAKKQQAPKSIPLPVTPRYNAPRYTAPSTTRMPVPRQPQPVRYNSKATRPTVANILSNKPVSPAIPAGIPSNAAASGFEVCEICGGFVKDRKALRIHFFYAHRIDLPVNLFDRNQAPLYCATCYVRFWTAQGLRKHIESHKEENQTRGVVGKCISCGHHVLNLLLHMRLVHKREMAHYVSAMMCMFCGGHFSSGQECEQHMLKAHGNVDPSTGTLRPASVAPTQPQTQKTTLNQKKGGSNSLVKGSVCVLCNLNFGRNVDLTRHCMRMHHTCMKCGMVVIDKASLLKHTCLSSASGTRDCTLCPETGFHPAYYVKHLRDKHLKKFTINVEKLSKKTIEKYTKRPCPYEGPDEVAVEISDSDDDAVIETKPSPAPIASGKRRKIGPACKIGRIREKQAVEQVEAENKGEATTEVKEKKQKVDVATTKESTSVDKEDDRSDDPLQGQKRRAESSDCEESSKRMKSE